MDEGAFALLDCLGFKGIWSRPSSHSSPEQIIGFLEQTEAHAQVLPAVQLHALGKQVEFFFAFVSDTVAIGARLRDSKPHTDHQRGFLVSAVGQACRDIALRFVDCAPPLLMRGSIAYGEYLLRKNFFVGPAVDEAASFFETAQGAFIWGTPEAARVHRTYMLEFIPQFAQQVVASPIDNQVDLFDRMLNAFEISSVTLSRQQVRRVKEWWDVLDLNRRRLVAPVVLKASIGIFRRDAVLMDYPIQLNTGGAIRADVLNPVFGVEVQQHQALIGKMMSSFEGKSLDILMKRQRTEELLASCSDITRKAVADAEAQLRAVLPLVSRLAGKELQF
jgi:hypothetical protein